MKKELATDLYRQTQTPRRGDPIIFFVCVRLCKSVAKKIEEALCKNFSRQY